MITIYGSTISGPSFYICDSIYLRANEIMKYGFEFDYGKIKKDKGEFYFASERLRDSLKLNFFKLNIDSSNNYKNILIFDVAMTSFFKEINYNKAELILVINQVDTNRNFNYLLKNKLETIKNTAIKFTQVEFGVNDEISQIEFILKYEDVTILTNQYKFEESLNNTKFIFEDNLYSFIEASLGEPNISLKFRKKNDTLFVKKDNEDNWSFFYPYKYTEKLCECSLEILYKKFKEDHPWGIGGIR